MIDRGRGTAAALALLLVAAAIVCTGPAARAALPHVSVVGDSVLLGASDQIVAQLAPIDVSVDARESLSLLGAIDEFRADAPTLGDIVVLDLGYNDMADPVVFRQRIDLAMSALAQVPRVIWLNQRVYADGRAAMNNELIAAETRYPNLDVADWDAVARVGTGLVYADGIHLTPAGQVAMAALVRQHVDAYEASQLPPAPAPTTAGSPVPSGSDSTASVARAPAPTPDDSSMSGFLLAAIAVAGLAFLVAVGVTVGARAERERREPDHVGFGTT